MSAPTEAEIREALTRALDKHLPDIDLCGWVYDIGTPLLYRPSEERDDSDRCLWDDLRKSEAARLTALREAIYAEADAWQLEIVGRIVDALVAAGVRFAAEYPNAPRAEHREEVMA